MKDIHAISSVISLWPSRSDLASDLGVSVERVHKWVQAEAIPAKFHWPVLQAAKQRRIKISGDLIARLHSQNEEGNT